MKLLLRMMLALLYFGLIAGGIFVVIITWPIVVWIPVILIAAFTAWICWVLAGDHVGSTNG